MNYRARNDSCREYEEAFADERRSRNPSGRVAALALALPLSLCLSGPVQAETPASVPGPVVVKTARGALVIVGGGMLPEAIRDRFLELAGGPKARMVVIPTASMKAESGHMEALSSYSYWVPLVRAGKAKSVVFLHTRRHIQANDPDFIKPLKEASGVWIAGGDQSLLTAAYKGTAVERELKNLLQRGGVVGGTSAGASVMSDLMIRYGNPVAEVGTGFGFLPGVVVDQHFHERNRLARLQGVIAKHPEYLGMGIDEQTGVIVQGPSVTVLGKRNVRVCYPSAEPAKQQVKVYASGAHIDLNEYQRLLHQPGKTTNPMGKSILQVGAKGG